MGSKLDIENDSVRVKTVAKINRIITVEKIDGEYKAVTPIYGMLAVPDHLYATATGRGLLTKVISIKFYGYDMKTKLPVYEKAVP